jgi:hypothetical protein
MQTIRLFYKVENDSSDVVVKYDRQKCFFQKVEDDSDLPEDEEEPEDEEAEEDEEEDDEENDENMTLEMRVKQLQKFSNYFSDEE